MEEIVLFSFLGAKEDTMVQPGTRNLVAFICIWCSASIGEKLVKNI
jgi:hypothetical protein